MIIFNLFLFLVSIIVLWLYFRKVIFKMFDDNNIKYFKDVINDLKLFKILWIVLVILFFGYLISKFIKILVLIFIGIIVFIFLMLVCKLNVVNIK